MRQLFLSGVIDYDNILLYFTGQSYTTLHSVPLPSLSTLTDVELEDFLSPLVLLWNPNITHHALVKERLKQCISCGMPYSMGFWNDGSTCARQPRKLHAMNNVVLLVSAVYVCENNHRLLSHDTVILDCFPLKTVIPFVLLHKTGFVREFVETCTSLIRTGVNFYGMETLIAERRMATYARGCNHFSLHKTVTQRDCISDENFYGSYLSECPSNSVLTKVFLASFLNDEHIYLQEMDSISVGSYISFDHTFKVASNIGYYRKDMVWVNQYDSLFLVMNCNGEVVGWQFTRGTAFEQVRNLLEGVCSHSHKQGQQVTTVYTDDCCKFRNKIISVFGPETVVKLDLFHAVQRITKTLSRKHPMYHQCLFRLRQVFREHGDSEEQRKSATPSRETIKQKLNDFCSEWSTTTIWTHETTAATKNLEKHISTGCLDHIPPGHGTNKNERFHRFLRSFFNRSKIGVALAYALMTVLIHAHNSRTCEKGKRITKPLHIHSSQKNCQMRRMGVISKTSASELGADHWEIDVSEHQLDMEIVVSTYSHCVEKFQIFEALKERNLLNMVKCISSFQPYNLSSMTHPLQQGSNTSIQEVLSNFGLVLSPSPRDGNCFFSSVASNILQDLGIWSAKLRQLGIVQDSNICNLLPIKLREIFVWEITGQRKQYYKDFTSDVDYDEEAKKFLSDGVYDSQVGNLMPLAIAEALETNLILFRTNDVNPLFITPQSPSLDRTVFLVYEPQGSGHYDAALVYSDKNALQPHDRKCIKCNCGVNTKVSTYSCCKQVRYTCRCVCLKAGKSCSDLCRCKGCNNPNGCKPAQCGTKTRKRRSHDLQIEFPSSKKFATERGERMSEGTWSNFENIVVKHIASLGGDYKNAACVLKLYNDIVYYARAPFCILFLPENVIFREKSYAQVSAKLALCDD